MKRDNTSKKFIANDNGAVSFQCPNECDAQIVRAKNARQIGSKWTCPKCGFEGP